MRTTFLAAGLAALSLVVAGCGDDEAETVSTATGASTSAAAAPAADAPKGDPIVLGSICSCTGPLAASLGKSLDVVKAWEKHTNDTGGLNGHPVKVVTVDDGQNPAKGLAAAKKLIETDKVIAIVGQMSLTSASWEKYVTDKGVPVVGGQSNDTPFITNPNFFASGTTLPVLLFAELAAVKQAGKKHLGIYYCAETPLCAQIVPIMAGLAKGLGIEVTGAKVSTTAPNYTAPCVSFKQKGVDALFGALNSDVVPRVVEACAKQGFKPLNVASSSTTQRSWLDSDVLDGSVLAATNANYSDESVPGVKTFTAAMDQYLPGLRDSPQFSYPLIYAWAGGELFAAAAKAGKVTPTSTPADVTKGLYALNGETLDGLAPPLTFAKGKPGFPTCYFTSEVKDGAFKTVGDGKPTCLDEKTAGGIAAALAG